VVIFAFIGILCDIKFHTKPWLTLLGTVIGFYFASVLIRKQINRSKELS
jgi:F0F1-type ATP synthase assembly protein I